MQFRQSAVWLFKLLSIGFAYTGISDWDACSGRLERALDALHRDSIRRNNLDEEEIGTLYQRELHSVPLEMSVSRMAVKLSENTKETRGYWARVEQCVYDPDHNSLRTRIVFNDLSVSGIVSLIPRNHQALISAESCKMTLRLRRAGIDFLTNPITRGRGQMRIRTESSFLEPRFASIYAYDCRTTRIDKQIKRQDKWPPYHLTNVNKITPTLSLSLNDKYDAAEPRQLTGNAEKIDIVIPNENRRSRYLHVPETNFGVWKKNSWITKLSSRQKRSMARYARATFVITPWNFTDILINKRKSTERPVNFTKILNLTDDFRNEDPSQHILQDLVVNDNFDNLFSVDSKDPNRINWQSKEYITKEMEEVFLQGASQALTRYIERQLHPAIKETLMLSMGYTISYG
ncbi:PREDICTED: uncharacterized protein LOC108767773 [Trachymyrmex cornetzi]|uniref:Uncharacterized protein n=1 Tax=Trachymyrmex cornetzi TaxID=471704 RepID=A0A151IVU4_9HYME|nr:PREDICTED: uncharacterized protein LOC108767773 [Trachymyrmex cornetzi]KYN11958.1 hypothetical protein ALC57_15922 [Trachymyrmex cornetzi]